MSGCFGADYINHKVYAYLFEYAIKNNEPLPNGVFADCDDIMNYNYEDNEDYSSNKCETCKSICGRIVNCGNCRLPYAITRRTASHKHELS